MTSSVNNTMGRHTTSGVAEQGRTPRTRRGFNVAVEHAAKNGFPSVTAARVDFCLRPATTARRLALSNARYLPPARVPHPHATASLWRPPAKPLARRPTVRRRCACREPEAIVCSPTSAHRSIDHRIVVVARVRRRRVPPSRDIANARERRASRRRVQDVDCGPSEQDVWWADG